MRARWLVLAALLGAAPAVAGSTEAAAQASEAAAVNDALMGIYAEFQERLLDLASEAPDAYDTPNFVLWRERWRAAVAEAVWAVDAAPSVEGDLALRDALRRRIEQHELGLEQWLWMVSHIEPGQALGYRDNSRLFSLWRGEERKLMRADRALYDSQQAFAERYGLRLVGEWVAEEERGDSIDWYVAWDDHYLNGLVAKQAAVVEAFDRLEEARGRPQVQQAYAEARQAVARASEEAVLRGGWGDDAGMIDALLRFLREADALLEESARVWVEATDQRLAGAQRRRVVEATRRWAADRSAWVEAFRAEWTRQVGS